MKCSLLLVRLSALALAFALALVAVPALACGCGAYIPREGEANVNAERALIRWDGSTEDVVMELSVQGSSAEAAWIVPVPSEATVQLGDAELFDALQELTKPLVQQYRSFPSIGGFAGSAPEGTGGAPVTVLGRQALGPFDVSSLAATDAGALSGWLEENGYQFPPELADALEPYVERGWFYVAVRLTPGDGDEELGGELEPLWMTFDSDEIVYPMIPSRLAQGSLSVFLYVLADHRVRKDASFGDSHIPFADWVEPDSIEEDSPIRPFVSGRLFLTKFEERIWDPSQIDADYVFDFAPNDEPYRDVIYEPVYEFLGINTFVWLLCLICLAGLAVLASPIALGLFIERRRRRRETA